MYIIHTIKESASQINSSVIVTQKVPSYWCIACLSVPINCEIKQVKELDPCQNYNTSDDKLEHTCVADAMIVDVCRKLVFWIPEHDDNTGQETRGNCYDNRYVIKCVTDQKMSLKRSTSNDICSNHSFEQALH